MEPRDVVHEASRILDRAARNVTNIFIVLGYRFTPATIETIRGILSSAIAEGIALGERYARWHRGTPPTRIEPGDEDVHDTKPGFKSRRPPRE
jgi:hypothetical protein